MAVTKEELQILNQLATDKPLDEVVAAREMAGRDSDGNVIVTDAEGNQIDTIKVTSIGNRAISGNPEIDDPGNGDHWSNPNE